MSSRSFAWLAVLGVVLVGCGSGSSTLLGTGSAGTTGNTGTAGGAAGTTGGAAGATSGTAGATSGNAGIAGGTAGASGGAAGAGGATDTAGTSGGTAGTTGPDGGTTSGGGTSGGAGGTTGAAGMAAAGGRPSGPSPGCNQPPPASEPIGQAVLQHIAITGMAQEYVNGYTNRIFCTTIPNNYDNTKQYPVVFYGPGCGATGCEGSSFTGRDDIFYVEAISSTSLGPNNEYMVPKNGSPGCFQAGVEGTTDSPEGPYFDQVMDFVESRYCTDRGKVYAAGTSSGGWLSNYLGCARGNRIRAIAADSGGIQFNRPTCTGGAAALEFPGDSASKMDAEGNQIGVAVARDMFIQLNGCSMTPTMMTFGGVSCSYYGGCSSPVAYCPAAGGSHQAGDSHLSASGSAFWDMLQ